MNNLRKHGALHEQDGHKLWVIQGDSPLMLDIVRTHLNKIEPPSQEYDSIAIVREAFLIMEGMIVDAEFVKGSHLADYWEARAGQSVASKWHTFNVLLTYDDATVLINAYQATRLTNIITAPQDDDIEKKESDLSQEADSTQQTARKRGA